jgi:hypothetical protein
MNVSSDWSAKTGETKEAAIASITVVLQKLVVAW